MKLSEKQIAKIYKQVELGNKQIVMLDVMGDKSISISEKLANIYSIDQEKNIIWQVSEIKTKPPYDNDGFVYLSKNDQGKIIADRFSGFTYEIDPETGEATRTGFHK
ncbi:hypothetical protein [Rickettsiella endosymbiont of Xylota segnis]|uniref:hypothetical protein n=1 Tax=Rickettsiella endosymbiont of Xylota segnis TaxID=3066238 RepID=UPI0030CCFF99